VSESTVPAGANLPAMPLEGHWKRTNTPLRRLSPRERNVAIAAVAATLAAIVVLLAVTAGDTRPPLAPGCFRATVAGRTGGEPVTGCGAEAVSLCRRAQGSEGPWAEAVSGACLDAGIRF
jgi:hypothetical protein